MNIFRTPSIRVLLHFRWPVAEGARLRKDDIERLSPYTKRYAQTLGAIVHEVGGVEDHLHLLLDMPPTISIDDLNNELQKATRRFLRDVLGRRDFAWAEDGLLFASISPEGLEEMADYIREQPERHASGQLDPFHEAEDEAWPEGDDDMPDWLRGVLPDG